MVTKPLSIPRLSSIRYLWQNSLVRAGLWGMADQALISATNFVTMVLLARSLSPSAFGAFTLAYTALLFANSLQSALITQPHNVIGATRTGEDYVGYTTATAGMQLALALAYGFVIAAAAIMLSALDISASRLLLALVPATAVWQLQEFMRRVLYTKQNVIGALVNDGVSYGGQLVGIVALWKMGSLTEVRAILVLAITSAIATVAGLWQIRDHLTAAVVRVAWRAAVANNWRMGKWLTASALLSLLSSQLHLIFTAGLVNIAAVGALRATQTILRPTQVLLTALDTLMVSRMAAAHENGGPRALRLLTRQIYIATFPIVAAYYLILVVFSQPILRLLYGEAYVSYGWLLAANSLTQVLVYLGTPVGTALRAMKLTAPVFKAYVISVVFDLTVGIAAVATMGLIGAVVGMAIHLLIMNAVLWRHYFEATRS